ncbi:MAG: hypothetical protein FJ317_07110 [SAR202 cluster bacterium]|nr:hypothetical protein [SAR202 cluster bacterium]
MLNGFVEQLRTIWEESPPAFRLAWVIATVGLLIIVGGAMSIKVAGILGGVLLVFATAIALVEVLRSTERSRQ